VAIAATYQASTAVTTTAATVYTTLAATVSTYTRDLVVTNSGANTIFIGLGASNVATSVASFGIPSGGSVLLTQCQLPASTPLTAICGVAGGSSVSVGYASDVSVI
jgi:hypothetical protein